MTHSLDSSHINLLYMRCVTCGKSFDLYKYSWNKIETEECLIFDSCQTFECPDCGMDLSSENEECDCNIFINN